MAEESKQRVDKKAALGKLRTATSIGQSVLTDANAHLDAAERHGGGLSSLDMGNEDPVEFLMDVASTILGSRKLKGYVDKLFRDMFNPKKKVDKERGRSLEEALKEGLLKALTVSNEAQKLPADFLGAGYTLPVKAIDLFDLYKSDPNNNLGKVLFGQTTADFNFAFYTMVLQSTGSSPQVMPAMPTMSFAYSRNTTFVQVRATGVDGETTVNDYFRNLVMDKGYKLVDRQRIMVDVMDAVFKTVSANKTKRGLEMEETLRSAVTKIANQENDTVFDFDPRAVELAVEQARSGAYTLDLGCSREQVTITDEQLLEAVGAERFTEGVLRLMGEHSPEQTGNAAVSDNLYRGLFRAVLFAILKNTLFSPRIWTLVMLSGIIKTGWAESPYPPLLAEIANSPINQQPEAFKRLVHRAVKDKSLVIKVVADIVLGIVVDYLLDLVIREIVKLVAPVQAAKCLETAQNYKDFMASLSPLKLR